MELTEIVSLAVMPLTYGFTGWITNRLALKMTFYPLEFRGWFPPYLGWQGIIPRKAYKMAGKYVEVITERLITIEEVFGRIEPEVVTELVREEIEGELDSAIEDVGHSLFPDVWKALPRMVLDQIRNQARNEIRRAIREVFEQLRTELPRVFDIKGFVFRNLTGEHTGRLVEMFQRVGAPEFRFIERSGVYFGVALGLVQVGLWLLLPYWWTLPIQGIVVGYLTNWIALRMIFRPLREKRYGPLRYQGLFLKRQAQVSQEFSRLIAREIMNSRKLTEEILYGHAADALLGVIQKQVGAAVDRVAGVSKPLLVLSSGEKYERMKGIVIDRIHGILPASASRITAYLDEAMDIEATMTSRMQELTPEEFEEILRSAFREDELLLILIGAALGAIIGTAQAFLMLLT